MTLRSAYFEQDFKGGPRVLLWGDMEGMRDLRDFLRQFRTAEESRALASFC